MICKCKPWNNFFSLQNSANDSYISTSVFYFDKESLEIGTVR